MTTPALSAILITPDTWEDMRNTLHALRRQTVRPEIELILVGPSRESLEVPESELEGFAGVVRVPVADMSSLGNAAAAGVRAANAPLVVFTEDHCFPEPGWAEAFIRRHESGTWAGVGPGLINANPDSAASWAQFTIEYGYFSAAAPAEVAQIPGHNSCYRRDALQVYEADLADWLEVETRMQWDMVRRGQSLYLERAARTRHWNCARLGPSLRFAWVFSQVFASFRAREMSALERIKFGLLWPMIPVLRFKRLWPILTGLVGRKDALRVLPGLILNLVVSGASEGKGYLFGHGKALAMAFDLEFHRERFLPDDERRRFFEGPPDGNAAGVADS